MLHSHTPDRSSLLPGALWVTAFITGAEILAVEIVGARLITPQFGVSLYVWSSLIAVTLIALAVGYALGGRVADRRGRHGTKSSGDLCLLLLIAALALASVPSLAGPVFSLTSDLGLRSGSLLSAGLLFTLPLAALAMITPYIVRLLVVRSIAYGDGGSGGRGASPPEYNIGRAVGGVYALSTAGSVLGALATGFWLVPLFPLPRIFLVLALGLVVVAALLWAVDRSWRQWRRWPAVVLLIGTALALWGGGSASAGPVISARFHRLFEGQSLYGEWRVLETDEPHDPDGARLLLLNGIIQGGVDPEEKSVFPYTHLMEQLLESWHPEPRRLLLVGLGAGVMARSLQQIGHGSPVEVDVAEIDPMAVELARRYFGYAPPTGTIAAPRQVLGQLSSSQREREGEGATQAPTIETGRLLIEDGRRLLSRTNRLYDAVILDAYAAEALPFHLFSVEAFRAVRQRLEPDGVLLINTRELAGTIASPGLQAVVRTLREVFPVVAVYASRTGGPLDSRFLVASMHKGQSAGKPEAVAVTLERGPFRGSLMTAWALPIDDRGGRLLTDAFNPMEWLDAPVAEAAREATRRYLR